MKTVEVSIPAQNGSNAFSHCAREMGILIGKALATGVACSAAMMAVVVFLAK